MNKLLLCLFLSCFSVSLAQDMNRVPLTPSQRVTFGDKKHTNRDALFFSKMNSRGHLIVAGTTEKDYSFTDVHVKALDNDLNVLWTVERSWDGISYDYPMDVLIDSEDHVWVISKNVINLYEANWVITRIDPNGKMLWEYVSPEPVETHTLNMNQYFYYFDEEGNLKFNYVVGREYTGKTAFFAITPNGIIKDEFETDLKLFHLSRHENYYHGITFWDEELKTHYVRFNENEKEEILLQHEGFENVGNYLYESNTDVITDKTGNLILIGQGYFANVNQAGHTGSLIISIGSSGEINYYIPNDGNIDKYLLGHKIDDQNNLVVLSNTRPTGTNVEPVITLEIFSEEGELLLKKVDQNVNGNIAVLENNQILVRGLDENLTIYDYNLNKLNFFEVEPINTTFVPQGLQLMDGLPVVIGTSLAASYPNSDYLSLQDHIVRKFNSTGEEARMTYNGEGTSKLYTYSMSRSEEGNYSLQALEFTGPDNPFVGGSRSPKEKKVITYNSGLELLDVEIVEEHEEWEEPVAQFTTANGDKFLYEITADKKGIKFYLNGQLTWERQLEFEVFRSKIDKEGNLVLTTSRYDNYPNHIFKFTPQNEYTLVNAGDQVQDFVILSNNWIFTFLDNRFLKVYSSTLELINAREASFTETGGDHAPHLREKNNKVLFNIRNINLINVYDQYANFVTDFRLDGSIHDSQALFDENDALVVYHSIGNGIPLEHGYNWSRGALSRYDHVVRDYIGGLPEGDSDGDGVLDFYDQCPDTTAGAAVNEKGCMLLQLAANHFTIKVKGESCPGKNNGQLDIIPLETGEYQLELRGETYSFNNSVTFDRLPPGEYEVCVWVKGEEQTRRCYAFAIEGGQEFLAESRVSSAFQKKELEVSVSNGTAPFEVTVNGISAGSFTNSSFHIPVYSGDEVVVRSAVACEGNLNVKIEGAAEILLVPNPVITNINLVLPNVPTEQFRIEIYNSSGQKVKSLWQNKGVREFSIPATDLGRGVYFIRLYLEEVKTIKFLKS